MATVCFVIFAVCCVFSTGTHAQKTAADDTFTVTTISHKPFLYQEDGQFKGLVVDIMNEAEGILNKTFTWQHVQDGMFGRQLEDQSWTGMIGEIQRGEADIAAAGLTLTAVRAAHVDFSLPFMTTGYRFLVSKNMASALNVDVFHFLLTPLNMELWFVSLVMCAVVAMLLGLISKFSPWEKVDVEDTLSSLDNKRLTLPNSIYFVFSALTRQGYSFSPRSLSGRLLVITWWVVGALLLLVYTSNLAAFLLVRAPSLKTIPFLTFSDMAAQSDVDYGMIKGGSTMKYFKNSKKDTEKRIWKGIWSKVDFLPTSTDEGARRARSEKFAFIVETASADHYANSQPCDLMVLGETLSQISYGFACRKGSGICKLLDSAILKLKEDSIMDQLQRKWFAGDCAVPGTETFTTYDPKVAAVDSKSQDLQDEFPITLERFLVPVVFLIVGILISISIMVGEIFWAKRYGKPSISGREDRHHFAVDTQQLS